MVGGYKTTRSNSSNANSDDSSSSSNAALEELISKVCANFASQLEGKINKQFEKLEEKMSEVTNSLKSLNDKAEINSKEIKSMEAKSEYMEQYLKRNSLRFHGITEEDGENICDVIISFINTKLKVSCNIRDIDSIFRLGRLVNTASKPRGILVSFIQNIKRNEVFNAKTKLKNS